MFQPSNILINNRWIYVIRHESSDRSRKDTPWSEVLNPLRYQINLRKGRGEFRALVKINKDAWMHLAFNNSLFWTKVYLRGLFR